MKAYQKIWLDRITNTDDMEEIERVCREILADDTGDTCPLVMALAKAYLDS